MKCQQAVRQLELGAQDETLLLHLRQCPECAEQAEELQLRQLLRTLPLPQSSAGFEKRVIQDALGGRGKRDGSMVGWWVATAASVTLAVLVTLLWARQPSVPSPQDVAQLVPVEPMPVTMVLSSTRELEQASITVHMPPGLALQGYPGQERLHWQVDLAEGDHKLTLPVVLDGREGAGRGDAKIRLELEHNGRRKEFWIPVERNTGDDRRPKTIHSA